MSYEQAFHDGEVTGAEEERRAIIAWLKAEMAEWPADQRLPSLVEDLESGAWKRTPHDPTPKEK